MKALREVALQQIADKQKQRIENASSLLNTNKREAVREQMKVRFRQMELNNVAKTNVFDTILTLKVR
jgi:hypothetical protein